MLLPPDETAAQAGAVQILSGITSTAPVERPEGVLFWSPLGLFPFQVDATARSYWQFTESGEPVTLVIYDTGIGKTVIEIATSAMLVEDGLVDQIVVVAEQNKIDDWAKDDFPKFSALQVGLYAGDPKRRKKMLLNPPQVLVMSYETGRNDICTFAPKRRAIRDEGPLTGFLRGKRVLIIFDEFTKLRSRQSRLYLAWDYLVNRVLRKTEHQPMIAALTATPLERDPADHWNAGRLLAPWRAGTVEEFERTYVASYDMHENPKSWKNLRADACAPGVTPLSEMFGPITMRKRKSDPDVRNFFPRMVENAPTLIRPAEAHRDLYEAVEEIIDGMIEAVQTPREAEVIERKSFGLLRQLAGHPLALLSSSSDLSAQIVANVGEGYLRGLEIAKVERMLEWAHRNGDQQMVIFTFFGQSVLPHLDEALRQHGFSVSLNHGRMTGPAKHESRTRFRNGETQVFLSSDAGAKGLNLGVGSALLHYELPLLYSVFVQRSNRVHRIDSVHDSVTVDALVSSETVEDGIANLLIRRNGWSDAVIDDDSYAENVDPGEGFLNAADRRAMLNRVRRLAA